MLRYGTAGSFFLIVNDWARCMYGGMDARGSEKSAARWGNRAGGEKRIARVGW